MNGAHLHLIINHLPVVGIGMGILLLIVALIIKNEGFIKAGMTLFFVSAIAAIPVYLSGHEAHEIIEQLPGVADNMIKPHAQLAFYALIGIETLGLLSLFGLVISRNKSLPPWLINLLLVVSIMMGGILSYTAKLGGEIHHPEARPGFVVPVEPSDSPGHTGNSY